jgi:nucleoside-triphosphatase THEP1
MRKGTITIVTGELHQGKTSKLKSLIKENPEIAGFICEAVFDIDQRIGYDLVFIPENTRVPFLRLLSDLPDNSDKLQYKLGRYAFLKRAFEQAEFSIKSILAKLNDTTTIVIDELGFLEIDKKGFYEIGRLVLDAKCNLLTAVRKSSLEGVLAAFGIKEYNLIDLCQADIL